jgi:hypothetical protein
MDGLPLCGAPATTSWHFDAGEVGPSTPLTAAQEPALARQLAGKPRVARPRNGDHAGTILAKQHGCCLIGIARKTM